MDTKETKVGFAEKINYNQLLLRHLEKISSLTASLFDDFIYTKDDNGKSYPTDYKKVKYDCFNMAITTLISLVPESLLDDDYKKVSKKLDEDYKNKTKLSDNYPKNMIQLNNIINLFDRKGLLFSHKEYAE